ncbi:MAG: AmmeMemoRadiSam system protein B, partial [Thermodesulfobacteriota bacterium]
GGIVPHAGWYYSGAIACNIIAALQGESHIDTIVIFGMHLHPSSSAYIMAEGTWETPFGDIEIHSDLADMLLKNFSFMVETPENYTPDNTIELQLPFIKYLFKDVRILPMGVPPRRSSLEIGKAVCMAATKMGEKIKVIGSTDLTHYGQNYGYTPKGGGAGALKWVKEENDRRFIDAVCSMDPERAIQEGITHRNACCSGAAATAISAAKALGAEKGKMIAYSTSYDKSPAESFVGYAGILFQEK